MRQTSSHEFERARLAAEKSRLFSVLSSEFCVLSSVFGVLCSVFSVLCSVFGRRWRSEVRSFPCSLAHESTLCLLV